MTEHVEQRTEHHEHAKHREHADQHAQPGFWARVGSFFRRRPARQHVSIKATANGEPIAQGEVEVASAAEASFTDEVEWAIAEAAEMASAPAPEPEPEPAPEAPVAIETAESAEAAAAREAATAEGLPTELEGYQLVRLTNNKRTSQRLFVFKNDTGGTFVGNAKCVRKRVEKGAGQ